MEVQEGAEALEPAHSPTDTEATLPATGVNPSYLPEPVYPWKPEPTSPLQTPHHESRHEPWFVIHGVCFHG